MTPEERNELDCEALRGKILCQLQGRDLGYLKEVLAALDHMLDLGRYTNEQLAGKLATEGERCLEEYGQIVKWGRQAIELDVLLGSSIDHQHQVARRQLRLACATVAHVALELGGRHQ